TGRRTKELSSFGTREVKDFGTEKLFGYHGRVMDEFIPKKRGAAGRRFGFVRYGNIRDARRGIERLDDFMMMNQRLGGNMVQFQGRKTF
ncbi:hypothetical protein Goklo_011320, partial [Gossypium klotzschianum]|nr:hypothetical protein [Gossypium klotzschianum]